MAQRRWEQKGRIRLQAYRLRFDVGMNVFGQSALKQLIPKPIGPVRIVIAGKQVPLDFGEGAHPLDRLVARNRCKSFLVVHIARGQHMSGIMLLGKLAKAAYGVQSSLLQEPHCCLVNITKHLADLPVSRVYESESHWKARMQARAMLTENATRQNRDPRMRPRHSPKLQKVR